MRTAFLSIRGDTILKISFPNILYCPPTLLALIRPRFKRRFMVLLEIFKSVWASLVV